MYRENVTLVPDADVVLEEVKVLQYLSAEGQLAKANGGDQDAVVAATAKAIAALEAIAEPKLTGPEILQLLNLHVKNDCDVYTVVSELEQRCADAEAAVAAIIAAVSPTVVQQQPASPSNEAPVTEALAEN